MYPVFEESTSPLVMSNDGRLHIHRQHDVIGGPGFVVVDSESEHVQLFTLKREIADAFVAGYDYARFADRDNEGA